MNNVSHSFGGFFSPQGFLRNSQNHSNPYGGWASTASSADGNAALNQMLVALKQSSISPFRVIELITLWNMPAHLLCYTDPLTGAYLGKHLVQLAQVLKVKSTRLLAQDVLNSNIFVIEADANNKYGIGSFRPRFRFDAVGENPSAVSSPSISDAVSTSAFGGNASVPFGASSANCFGGNPSVPFGASSANCFGGASAQGDFSSMNGAPASTYGAPSSMLGASASAYGVPSSAYGVAQAMGNQATTGMWCFIPMVQANQMMVPCAFMPEMSGAMPMMNSAMPMMNSAMPMMNSAMPMMNGVVPVMSMPVQNGVVNQVFQTAENQVAAGLGSNTFARSENFFARSEKNEAAQCQNNAGKTATAFSYYNSLSENKYNNINYNITSSEVYNNIFSSGENYNAEHEEIRSVGEGFFDNGMNDAFGEKSASGG